MGAREKKQSYTTPTQNTHRNKTFRRRILQTWTHRSLQGRGANCRRSVFLLSQTSRGSKTSHANMRVMCLASILVGIKNHENWKKKKKKDTQPTVPRQWRTCGLVIHCDNDTRIVTVLTFTGLDSRFLIFDWFIPGYANNEYMHNRCHAASALGHHSCW